MDDESESEESTIAAEINAKICILCHESSSLKLSKLLNKRSWKTLQRAAKLRNYEPILDIAEVLDEDTIPSIHYHRNCRSTFTNERDLKKLVPNQASQLLEQKSKRDAHHRNEPSFSRVYADVCIFCGKIKYLKGSNTREQLVQSTQLRTGETLRVKALEKLDSKIIAATSRDMVAAEAHYHRSCYRSYIREENRGHHEHKSGQVLTEEEQKYDAATSNAYEKLFSYIRNTICSDPRVITFSIIKEMFTHWMHEAGVAEIKTATTKHIRRKLETEFEDAVHIFAYTQKTLLLFPNTLTVQDLAIQNHRMQAELDVWRSNCDNTNIINQAAIIVRKAIKEMDDTLSWPPQPAELTDASRFIPAYVKQFVQTVLTGETEPAGATQKTNTLVDSYGQDLVYAVTGGKQLTPKHILLPFAVKTLTGNVEVVQILNRLGHGVSHPKLEEIDTALCLQKLAWTQTDTIPLPQNIHAHVFTTLAWDNIDRLEETLTGADTSHRVNGIAIQPVVYGPFQDRGPVPSVEKSRQRSIDSHCPQLQQYNVGERVGPPTVKALDKADKSSGFDEPKKKNLVWILARLHERQQQEMCSWTGFNILIHKSEDIIQNNLGYLPTINSPATNMSTVFEVLQQSITIMNTLQLNNIVVTFDQALYAKAAEIVWKHGDMFNKIVLRLGAFHTMCTLQAVIGKRFQDAGLKDLCIEAGILAEGSVSGVFEGRRYNRGVRIHKLLYEAMMRLQWKGFLQWLEENDNTMEHSMQITNEKLADIHGNLDNDSFGSLLKDSSFLVVASAFHRYQQFLHRENGTLSAFWASYIDIVEILLGLLRASREGDWELHLSSIRAMIPWCFAYDNHNYARYLSVYYAQMTNLSSTHPEVHEYLQKGGFTVQLGSENPFGRIPVDQALEESVNKDTQTAGGTKGFSLKPGAVAKYYLMAEYRSIFLGQIRNATSTNRSFSHTDLQQTRISRDEADVSSVVDMLENNWINPFSNNLDLVSLSTAAVAPVNVASDLMKALEIGEKSYSEFTTNRLQSSPPVQKFHDRLPRNNLKTFKHLTKKKITVHTSQTEIVLMADRNLFAHMIIMAESRKLDMKSVFSHPLGPLPLALAHPDGSMRKTNKSALARELEKGVPSAEVIPKPSCSLIDGIALVQKMKADNRTFQSVADMMFAYVLNEGSQSQRIDVVFDVYRDLSIKNAERSNRGSSAGTRFKNISPGHTIKQWRKFLSNSCNKRSLIDFLVTEWKKPKYVSQVGTKELFVTCEEHCTRFAEDTANQVEELTSTQEEADTRILLHAKHAYEKGYKTIIVCAEDTDVLLLTIAFSSSIPAHIYMKVGTSNRVRFIDISKVQALLGTNVSGALLGLHAFTGCDTVSSFAGKGKITALKLLKANTRYQECFQKMGVNLQVADDMFEELQKFTCHLYGSKTDIKEVNILRHHLFVARKGEIESHQLPPCKDCLWKHSQRANFQAIIWRKALESKPIVPSPDGQGWNIQETEEDKLLSIDWMSGLPAPEAVLELLSCKCNRSCKLPSCTCLANGLRCTTMCKLKGCTNQAEELDDMDDDSHPLPAQMMDEDDEDD